MPKESITICAVSWYSYNYLVHLFDNLLEKAENKNLLTFLIIDNTNGQDVEIGKLTERFNGKIIKNDSKGLKGSYGHASGLNSAMEKLYTEYTLIVDPDIHIFKEKWDTFLVNLIKNNNFTAAGASYPRWQLGKYHNFPNPVFCFFKTEEYLKLNPDWTPFTANKVISLWDFFRRNFLRLGILINRRVYEKYYLVRKIWSNLEKIVGVCSRDTGWRIAKIAEKHKVKSITFDAVTNGETLIHKNEALAAIAREYELYCYENEPILTHKYSTCSILWKTKKSDDKDYWDECIEKV